MKVIKRTIVLFVSISIFTAGWAKAEVNEPKELTFEKYYEPYEPNIEPNAPGYTLPLELTDIINFSNIIGDINNGGNIDVNFISTLIRQNGFAIFSPGYPFGYNLQADNIDVVYEYLSGRDIPFFVTTDTLLHLYHLLFDKTLKDIEEREFIQDINDLTISLLNDSLQQYEQFEGELKEAAGRNAAYLSVAKMLIDPNASAAAFIDREVAGELAKIEAHQGFAPSDIFIYEEDYSQYVPRGHYTRSEQLKKYFKTVMWYGRMAFLIKGGPEGLINEYDARIQTLQAFLLANSLQNMRIGERSGLDIWDRLYIVTAFYVGIADDLTPYDYLWALDQVFGADFVPSDLENANNQLALKVELALLPSPKIYGGTGNIILNIPITEKSLNEVLEKTKGMRLMGQRFVPDSYMFQNLVFPQVNSYLGNLANLPFTAGYDGMGGFFRAYVRGLDVMAVLGSREALKILIDEGDTDYQHFWKQFGQLKDEFDVLNSTEWNRNLYWSWLYTLKALLDELPEGYPNFVRTQAWQRRQLNAALASWTQLRHDTILYAKQSYTPAKSSVPVTPPPGYIEPVPVFWSRLLAMTLMASRGLDDLNVLTPEARGRFNGLEILLRSVLDIVAKQLTNMELSTEDRAYIKAIPATLDSIVTGMEDVSLKTTLAADVHTYGYEEQVVEEATGNVDLIVVACPMPDGKAFLALGPLLSYYEFKHPMSDRLTDEAWRQLLDSPQKPERPKWYGPLMSTASVDP